MYVRKDHTTSVSKSISNSNGTLVIHYMYIQLPIGFIRIWIRAVKRFICRIHINHIYYIRKIIYAVPFQTKSLKRLSDNNK